MLMLVLYLAEKKTKSVFIRKVDSLFGILFIYCKERKCTLGLWFSASFKKQLILNWGTAIEFFKGSAQI